MRGVTRSFAACLPARTSPPHFSGVLALGMASGGAVGQLAWSLGLLPVWLVIAKLLGLYDRDERPLRHTTIDEAESLVLWGVSGTYSLLCSCCS